MPVVAVMASLAVPAFSQSWTEPVRGSWVRGSAQAGDVTLVSGKTACEIVVGPREHSAVRHAASLLAGDIAKISGTTPALVTQPGAAAVRVHLVTLGNGTVPAGIQSGRLKGKWEAYQVYTEPRDVWLVGSDFRGTAFASYALSERLGIDPLYIWTGYTPQRHNPLVLKKTDDFTASPTFKYRGMFHDDEDILPRGFDPRNGYPYIRGTVPDVWYQRFFETALRLRMNMVAPYTRVHRHFRINKMASDWGLFYTSHHYDILLSNPYGFDNFGLAKERGVEGKYDYFNNRAGIEKYWKAGVEENKSLDAIYPVGIRGTDDAPYAFPKGTTDAQKGKVYEDAIREQIATTKALLPPDKSPLFTLTLYNEMLTNYKSGEFTLPPEVMLIWDDNGDGIMRDLPTTLGQWKHGVYYHLAFFGAASKQSVHTVSPIRVAQEFKKVVDSGATEYMLVNVSELREHVMEAREIAEICWDAKTALAGPNPAQRYINWWSREYFGNAAAPLAAQAYNDYYKIIDTSDKMFYGSVRTKWALEQLMLKTNGENFRKLEPGDVATLKSRLAMYQKVWPILAQAQQKMTPQQREYFQEHVRLGLAFDYYPTQSALLLEQALEAPDNGKSLALVRKSLPPLQTLEADIKAAERPPFQGWYRPTWIRVADYFNGWSDMNPHRPYDMVTMFLHGREASGLAPESRRAQQ
jgi:hypothetical protein